MMRLLVEAADTAETLLRSRFVGTPLQGVTRAQVAVFGVLDFGGPATVSDLARSVGITSQAMGESIRRLERDGLVSVASDPNDSRAKVVSITPLGADMLRIVWRELRQLEDRLAEMLGTDRLHQLKQDLAVIPLITRVGPAEEDAS